MGTQAFFHRRTCARRTFTPGAVEPRSFERRVAEQGVDRDSAASGNAGQGSASRSRSAEGRVVAERSVARRSVMAYRFAWRDVARPLFASLFVRRRRPRRMPVLVTAVLTLMLVPVVSAAQGPRLELPDFSQLAEKASETVDISLDTALLALAGRFMDADDDDEKTVKELLENLRGIYVRSYEFDTPNAFSRADVDQVRRQFTSSPGWSRLVGVRSRRERTDVDIFVWMDGKKPGGLAIVSTEPRQFTIVNIVGAIDLDKLRNLEGEFGIPRLDLERRKDEEQ